MPTHLGRKPLSPTLHRTLKEVRIPSKKRDISTMSIEPPTPKKQKFSKTVRFEKNELPLAKDERLQNEHPLHNERRPRRRVDDFYEPLTNPEILHPEESEEERERLETENDKENEDPHHGEENNEVSPLESSIDRDFQTRYDTLRASALEWASLYFPPVASSSSSSSAEGKGLDLLSLCTTSPELMEYANYISASASCGGANNSSSWERVFHERRNFLVYGILGKMLEVHVFGCEIFGATEQQLEKLREVDGRLVMKDGLLRQEGRSRIISAFLNITNTTQEPTTSSITTLPSNILASLTNLQVSFTHMLQPLLLPAILPLLKQATQHLTRILLSAISLSLSTRRSPQRLYHFNPHPAVGSLYSSQSMRVLVPEKSADDEEEEADSRRKTTDVQIVTMAGWPSLVANGTRMSYDWSVGLKHAEIERVQKDYRRILGRADVLVTCGQPVKPLKEQSINWLGPSLRDEMGARLEKKDRRVIVGSGLAAQTNWAVGWVFQQPWIVRMVRQILRL